MKKVFYAVYTLEDDYCLFTADTLFEVCNYLSLNYAYVSFFRSEHSLNLIYEKNPYCEPVYFNHKIIIYKIFV